MKWTAERKAELVSRVDRGDSWQSVARWAGVAASTAKTYYHEFRGGTNPAYLPRETVVERRTKFADFDPDRLRHLRERAGMTAFELGDLTGFGESLIRAFERGSRTPYDDSSGYGPTPVDKLCRALKCSPEDLRKPKDVPPSRSEIKKALSGMRAYIERVEAML